MKQSSICPKCGCTDVVPELSRGPFTTVFFVKPWTQVRLRAYACARCGYVEHYVDDMDDLHNIRTLSFIKYMRWILNFRRRLRMRRGQCVHCGYDLRASKDRCQNAGVQSPQRNRVQGK